MSLKDEPDDGPDRPPKKPGARDVRQITDAQTMRALSHPVRIALIERLGVDGPMTATEVAERIGESPTTCSFHLRQLAKYGFVEEAGGGKGRARPWRMTSLAFRFSTTQDDPEAEIAASALGRMFLERQLDRYTRWLETRATYPREWREAGSNSQYVFYLTADELEQFSDELAGLLRQRAMVRLSDPSKRPPGSVPVEMLIFSYPLSPPAGTPPAGTPPAGTPPADIPPTDTPRSAS